ncbi:T9SS type A sorting domain-containing protein [Paracrocinitomix mangrovi]|uniref:T9SS type A sorting domain-containing protein n=1 Tax=Paracrocinitomix mangrovi TaxID=2862509 RepID=UPI001C8D497D|nr:T9SS type A sorting domain-containing protein [Paracrocinitomix mangrovi]UKN03566.1 T9SS type A sorting domain-containing protein [Paracrocinitomix mangrovi]
MKKVLINFLVLGLASTSFAYKNFNHHGPDHLPSGDSRAANCAPANERLFMEFNNVRALVETGGSLWQDRANSRASYEVPAGSNKFVLYSGALWMGGEDVNGQLKLAAHMFRQGNDFWAGPLGDLIDGTGNYDPFTVQNAELTLYRDYGAAEIIPSECLAYDRFYTIRKAEVRQFIAWWNCSNGITDPADCEDVEQPNDEIMERIINWPAHGDVSLGQDFYLAPFYDNGTDAQAPNGIYDPINDGDYPWYDMEDEIDCRNDRRVTLFGDETHWWVFNDKGNIHTETGGDPIGMEIRAQAFAFATDDAINDMTFYNYELINRGTQTLYNTYFGQWVDPDIGAANNDYVGCDVNRGLGFAYNGESVDNGQNGQAPYGASPPAIGVDFFEGPYQDNDGIDNAKGIGVNEALNGIGYGDGIADNERYGMRRFVYHNIGGGPTGDPNNATDYYLYLQGIWQNGQQMVYGGDGFLSGTTLPTDFMFPGDTDNEFWGTGGVDPGFDWSEVSEQNADGDRRFLQSAGPFTLVPGAVNNITVGVVYGRNTAETDLEASVRTMKTADSKAQALFENCFELVEPPVAPNLSIQEMENELILFIEEPPGFDEQTWFEVDRINIITPDDLAQQGIYYDDTFRFEGYQIFQMVDAEASVADLDDIEKARLVAQCDISNGVAKLVNYIYDEQLDITIPQVMVDGADEGLSHSFRITEDQFATGARELVNHKKYYYIAVAYAYNSYKDYDPSDPDALDGQKIPYLRSRISGSGKGIEAAIGIPHDPSPEADGTIYTTSYGYQPKITQIEGIGNGGTFTQLDSAYRMNNVVNWTNMNEQVLYEEGAGPIDVKVIDPLNLADGTFTLRFGQDSSSVDEDTWTLTRDYIDENGAAQTESVSSDYVIGIRNEQLILDWGISVRVNQQFYIGTGLEANKYTEPIDATITYADSSKAWLTGVQDDDQFYPTNWIRSGSTAENETDNPGGCDPQNWIYNQCAYNDKALDDDQLYEKLLDGTVAPFNRVGAGVYGMPFGWPGDDPSTNDNNPPQGWFSQWSIAQTKSSFVQLHDVDIIITNDRNLWTRCPVIEINDNENQTEHGDDILYMRSDESVDKFGNPDGTGTGMGWFPGYAVDVNTGKRLNMVFSENSWLLGENGADMIWNPTSNFADQVDNPLFGGMHYIYVFGENIDNSGCPAYDEGAWLAQKFDVTSAQKATNFLTAWKNCMWVMEPMVEENAELMATDVEINLRINRPYEERVVGGENAGRPMYQFTIENATLKGQADRLESVLDNINVVPNPYYGYSEYETSKLDNRVKITNLPERCTITIFNMQGSLIRTFEKDDALTSVDWDLKNHKSVPIAGGLYLIHVKIPITENGTEVREQERIIKWYGALRQPDLDNL